MLRPSLVSPSKPEKGVIESAISAKIKKPKTRYTLLQEAFAARMSKAKESAGSGAELDPANLDANRQ